MYKKIFKPLFDFIFATTGLIILLPVFLVVTMILFVTNNGKPFFYQKRPGKNEEIFRIIKFKTMNDKKDKNGMLLSDTKRLTSIGSFLRKTSLDEIPQLINVIKGDMSFIGPRPLVIRYLPYYYKEEKLRHTVKPGITGWAQVNGRNTVGWDDRLAMDVYYVKNISFIFDVKIIIRTIYKVIKRDNIVVDPHSVLKNLDEERKDKFQKIQ